MVREKLVNTTDYHLKREITRRCGADEDISEMFSDDSSVPIQIVATCSHQHNRKVDELLKCTGILDDYPKIVLGGGRNVFARSVCAAIKDLHTINADAAVEQMFGAIREVLLEVYEKLTVENNNDQDVKLAKQGLWAAYSLLSVLSNNVKQSLKLDGIAVAISNNLETGTAEGKDGSRDGFPIIRILVVLPEDSFEHIAQYATEDYFFFKQLKLVLHEEDQYEFFIKQQEKINMLTEQINNKEAAELKGNQGDEITEKDKLKEEDGRQHPEYQENDLRNEGNKIDELYNIEIL